MADAEMDIISNESSDFTEDGLSELSESDNTLFLFDISVNGGELVVLRSYGGNLL